MASRCVRDARSARLDALDVEIIVAELFGPAEMTAALAGVEGVYCCPLFVEAARAAGVQHAVLMGQWLAAPAHP